MRSNYKPYDFEGSKDRINAILESPSSYEDRQIMPNRENLTFTNGFYINCAALFIDLRGSSSLPEKHQPRVLAKIYRSYISEAVAIINGNSTCKEVNIVGDCVSAIFETTQEKAVDNVLHTAAYLHSLIRVLNYKLKKKGYTGIKAGIGLSFGRVLMIKAGYSGSNINDVVYMGDAVNKASKMCSKASKEISQPIVMTPDFYKCLSNRSGILGYLELLSLIPSCYYTNLVNNEMEFWLKQQIDKEKPKGLWHLL